MTYKYDLEERLIDFSVEVMAITDKIPNSINGSTIARQLSRSGSSSALHYGEAQSAESRKDFIHKMCVVLKELRETQISLSLVRKGKLLESDHQLVNLITENHELISIFVKSIETARKNRKEC